MQNHNKVHSKFRIIHKDLRKEQKKKGFGLRSGLKEDSELELSPGLRRL